MPTDPSPESVAALAEALGIDWSPFWYEVGEDGPNAFHEAGWDHTKMAAAILSHPFTPAQRAALVAALGGCPHMNPDAMYASTAQSDWGENRRVRHTGPHKTPEGPYVKRSECAR